MESSTADPSSSIESTNNGLSTSISGPVAVDSSESEPEDSQEPGREVDV